MSKDENIGERLAGELEQTLEADLERAMALVDRVLSGKTPQDMVSRIEKLQVAVELLKVASRMPRRRPSVLEALRASESPSKVLDLDDDRAWLGADTLVHVEELDEDDVAWDEVLERMAR